MDEGTPGIKHESEREKKREKETFIRVFDHLCT